MRGVWAWGPGITRVGKESGADPVQVEWEVAERAIDLTDGNPILDGGGPGPRAGTNPCLLYTSDAADE